MVEPVRLDISLVDGVEGVRARVLAEKVVEVGVCEGDLRRLAVRAIDDIAFVERFCVVLRVARNTVEIGAVFAMENLRARSLFLLLALYVLT